MTSVTDLLALAWRHHQAGDLHQAEHYYRQVLQLDPHHADTLHLLGVLACQTGRPELGVDYLGRAVAVNPSNSDFHCNLGAAYKELGRLDEAQASLQRALACRPDHATACYNLGNVYLDKRQWADAAACYRRAVQLVPGYSAAYFNLGKTLWEQGDLDAAIDCYQRTVRLQPDSAEAHHNLGLILLAQGKLVEAIAAFDRALSVQPRYAEAHRSRGNAQRQTGQWDEAAASYRQALHLDPDDAGTRCELAALLRDQGRMVEAEEQYQEALRRRPSDWARLGLATMLPPVYRSTSELLAWRNRLSEQLNQLRGSLTLELNHQLPATLFRLAYQGLNDRDLQTQVAALYARACPALNEVAPHCLPGVRRPPRTGPIRVGFISYFFRTHSVAQHFGGFVGRLSRPAFHVVLLHFAGLDDAVTHSLQQAADTVVTLRWQQGLDTLRKQIAAEKLDVLFYPDIGMEPWTYFLAFARLAPVQCVNGGHPVTTGIPTIDYFLSSVDLEAEGAEGDYAEQLVRLTNIPNYYPRPERSGPPLSRRDFGLPEDAHLYVCVQTLFKIHPDFDPLIEAILRADPRGRVVLFHWQVEHWSELLAERLRRQLGPAMDRVLFLPRQPGERYMHLLPLADVLLDTPHFSGGTTSFQALGLGLPVVTLPGQFMRGRVTYACYRRMGMTDCIAADAEDYVRIAVRLATEPAWREQARARVRASNSVLFENEATVRELEQFFVDAVARSS